MHVSAQHVNEPGLCPDVSVSIQAASLHAPLVERLLELPMDIYAGWLSGELRVRIYDPRTWCALGRLRLHALGPLRMCVRVCACVRACPLAKM